MNRRSDSSLATLLLVGRFLDGDDPPLKAREYWKLVEEVGDPGSLLGLGAEEIVSSTGLRIDLADRLAALLGQGTALAFKLEELWSGGVNAVTHHDDEYPARLRERLHDAAPPILVIAGEPDLLERDGLGIVGSRDVSEAGAEVAREAARAAVDRGWIVASGGARGVDALAMGAAFERGGACVGVLADSLLKRLRDSETRRAVGEGQACLISPYKPDAGFSAGNAMGRNKLIYALATRTLVVASDLESGGTWAGATESLSRDFGEVAVWRGDGEGPGNGPLVANGAVEVHDITDLFGGPATSPPPVDIGVEALRLPL